MADINRIKGNISKMIDQGAPESDIESYLKIEGVSRDDLSGESKYQKYTPEVVKNFIGGAESGLRGFWNVPAGAGAQAYGTYKGLAAGEPLDKAIEMGGKAAESVTIDPWTKQGKLADEMIMHGIEAGVGYLSDKASSPGRWNPNAAPGQPGYDPLPEAKNKSFAEGFLNTALVAPMITPAARIPGAIRGKMAERTRARDAADAAEAAKTTAEAPKSTDPIGDILLSEIEKAELIKNGGDLRPDLPKNIPRGNRMPRDRDYFEGRDIMPDDTFVSSERLRAADAEGAPIIERTRPGREMLDEPIPPRQRELQFQEPTIEPPVNLRRSPGEPEQLGFNFDESRGAREARLADAEIANKPIVDRLAALEEQATRMSQDISQTNQLRNRMIPEEQQRTVVADSPAIPQAKVAPTSEMILPPRGQRGMANFGLAEAVTEKISDLISKARRNEKRDAKTQARLKAVNQSTRDAVSAVRGEERSWAEHLKQDTGGQVVDLPPLVHMGEKRRSFGEWWQNRLKEVAGNAAAHFSDPGSAYKWTKNPHIPYITDRVRSITSRWNMMSDALKEGARFDNPRVVPGKLVDPDSPAARYEAMGAKERKQAAEIQNDLVKNPRNVDKNEWLAKGMGQKAIDYVEKMQKNLNDMLGAVNEKLVSFGMAPIKESPWYLTKYFGEGKHQFYLVDKETGNHLLFHKFKNKKDGYEDTNQKIADLKAEGHNWDIEIQHSFDRRASVGDRWAISPSVIADIEASLAKSDPRRKILETIDRDILTRPQKAGGHTMRRKNVPGGEVDGKTIQKSYENYIDSLTSYIRNVELRKMAEEIRNHPDTKGSNAPIVEWTMDYLNRQMGVDYAGSANIAKLEKWFDEASGAYKIGGSRFLTRMSNKVANNAMLMFMNISHGVAQYAQSPAASSSGIKLYGLDHGLTGSSYKAVAAAFLDMAGGLSKDQKKFLTWEAGRGSIDPTATMEMSTINKNMNWLTDYVFTAKLPKSGEQFGRIHSSLAAYNYLYENGLRGPSLWKEAERISRDYIMADYSEQGRPAVLQRMGVAGEAMRTFSTYYNFWLNQTGVMLERAVSHGQVAPLVQFWFDTALVTGVIGTPFIAMISATYDKLKEMKWFQDAWKANTGQEIGKNSPKFEEILAQNLPDAALFGVIDASLGYRQMGALASPEMRFPGDSKWEQYPRSLFPGPVYAFDSISAGIRLAHDKLNELLTDLPTMTRGERTQALKKFMPGAIMDGIIDNWDTKGFKDLVENKMGLGETELTGKDTASVMGANGRGGYDRSTAFDAFASIAGKGTLPEQRKKLAGWEAKERELDVGVERGRVVTMLAEMYTGKAPMSEKKEQALIEKAIKLGYTPKDLFPAIRKAAEDLDRTKDERDVGKGRTPRQQRRSIDQILMEEASR